MQRKAYAPGRSGPAVVSAVALALGLGMGLTGCSSGATADREAVDSKAGPAAPAAQPGRYRTLFEPCGAVPRSALKDLLPGAAALPDAERDRTYRGTSTPTFDTDRRVGCSWKSDAPDAAHRLGLDIERVVSYDPTVSDDDRAQEVYGRKQAAAGIVPPPATHPATTPPSVPPSAPPATGPVKPSGVTGAGGAAPLAGHLPVLPPQVPFTAGRPGLPGALAAPHPTAATAPAATATATTPTTPTGPASPATGLEPRILTDLGDVAFLDDTLLTTGPSGSKRLVSVVFRTSNVIVTVEYEEQTTTSAEVPDSRELQEKARNLARLLAERLEE
ncbi:DUF3558 domain-containing protein [Streptomyces sp. NPDC053431]|uniref:DUF3558 domain-containing protein n=1 Tax=Streptomyces sp. NPDC053431 TaxID=3365703 RepID=UPI0037D459FE